MEDTGSKLIVPQSLAEDIQWYPLPSREDLLRVYQNMSMKLLYTYILKNLLHFLFVSKQEMCLRASFIF